MKIVKYKQHFTILLFLCFFLNLPIKSKENNLNKNSNLLRNLESSQNLTLNLTVSNETVTCDDNTTILLFFNEYLNKSNINIQVNGKESSFVECDKGNIGLNITYLESANSDNLTITIVFENNGSFSSLFENQSNIKEVKFVTQTDNFTITSLSHMFANCTNLQSVDFGSYNFEGVDDLSYMFDNCKNLKDVKFNENISTSNLQTVKGMFSGCESLTEVNLNSFTFENVENTNNLFYGCVNLINVTFSKNISSDKLAEIDGMFEGCEKIVSIEIDSFNFKNVQKMDRLFKGCKNLQLVKFNSEIKFENVENLSFVFDGCENLKNVDLTTIKFNKVKTMSNLFNNCTNLANVTFPTNLDVSNVETIDYLLAGWKELTSFDLSIFEFQNLKSVSNAFNGASSLQNITIGDNFNCTNCKSISGLFKDCNALTEIDLSGFKANSLSDVSSAFSGCESLQTLNLSGFVFEKGFKAKGFLEDCGDLQDLNLSNSRIYESDDYEEMFKNVNYTKLTINLEGAKISTDFEKFLKKK